jgi:hypothetical protein
VRLAIHPRQFPLSQKEVTANQFADGLDIAIAGSIIIELDGKQEYTLTLLKARHAILVFTGVLTAPVTITIPTEPANKKFIAHHAASGSFLITIKHANSQGIILQPHERRWIYSNHQEIYTLQTAPRLKTVPFANPLVLDCSDADRIFVKLTGDTTIQLTNAMPGQTITLILAQDESGNHQITWSDNVRFGADIPQLIPTTTPNQHDKITVVFNDDGTQHYDVVHWRKRF